MPLFSVIIPAYNRRELLRETLGSVLAQTFTDFEVIVVDDGSKDGTWEYLQSLGSRIQPFRQENLGPGAARNLGARHAAGEYLAFLDSDDLWFPWTLQVCSQLIERHGSPAIVSGKLVHFENKFDLSKFPCAPSQAEVFSDFLAAFRSNYFVGAGMSVLRKMEFLETGGYTHRPVNAEDHDLILRICNAPGFIQITSPVTVACRRHGRNIAASISRTVKGCLYLIDQEHASAYPGGKERALERSEIITRHVRPVALECLSRGLRKEALELYRATFSWHVTLRRWKFLAGFWFRFVMVRS